MVKHLIHQDDSFSHQQIFLEPGKVLDIKYIIVEKKKKQIPKPALVDNFLVDNLHIFYWAKKMSIFDMYAINK